MARELPHPFPLGMASDLSAALYSDLASLSEDQRFILMRLMANAYAQGHHDATILATMRRMPCDHESPGSSQ